MVENMKTEYTEDGYLKVSAGEDETLNYNEIQQMNTTSYILPSFRDRYEKNSILFHKGEYISFNEYLKIHEMDFSQLKKMVLQLTDIYIGMEQSGFQAGNIPSSLDCIFINEKSRDIKIIYSPMVTVTEKNGFHMLLKNICNEVHIKGAAILLGLLLEEANGTECNLSAFKAEIEAAGTASEVREVEKIVEKIVEVPVRQEKIIEKKTGDGKVLCMVAVVMELVTGIIIPVLLHFSFGNHVAAMPQVSTYILSVLMIIALFAVNYFIGRGKVVKELDSTEILEKKDVNPDARGEITNTNNRNVSERKQLKEDIQKKSNLQNAEDEVSKARIVRDTKTDYQKAYINSTYHEAGDEGTAVLFGSDPLNEAYIIEEGKAGLMDRIFIDCDSFIIGREQGVNYKIQESAVSKRHAEIKRIGGEYFIRDLNSSNGTFVNHKKINANTDTMLSDGSRLEIGTKKYTFCRK